MRQLNRDQYLLLKAATRSLIKSCGGLEAAAMITRVGITSLSDYGSIEKMDYFMPVDVVIDLQSETRCAPMTEALAAISGGAFVPQARERAPCGGLMESTADIMTQTADAIKSVSASLRDGRLTLRERTHMVRQIQEIIHACTEALLAIDGACQNSSEHSSEHPSER